MPANRPGLGTPLRGQDGAEVVVRAGTCSDTGIVRVSTTYRTIVIEPGSRNRS